MKQLFYTIQLTALTCLLLFSSCANKHRFIPKDTPPAAVEIVRFDSVILNLPTDSAALHDSLQHLAQSAPYPMMVFADNVIGVDYEDIDALTAELTRFLNDTLYGFKQVCEDTKREFADIRLIQQELNGAFGRMQYAFPEWEIPTLYFMITGFQGNALLLDDGYDFLIATDMYLGSKYPYYNGVAYEYQKKHMKKEYIVNHVLLNTIYCYYSNPSDNNQLLDAMLYEGRVRYLMQQFLPGKKPSYIIGYTEEEWDWCKQYEKRIWGLLCDKQDLFCTQPITISSYINEGPFTSEISQESPAQLGVWIGWRIVESYMNSHKEASLQDLLSISDSQMLLRESHYKP